LVTYRGILVILYCVKLLKYPYSQLTEFESSLVEVQLERILIRLFGCGGDAWIQ